MKRHPKFPGRPIPTPPPPPNAYFHLLPVLLGSDASESPSPIDDYIEEMIRYIYKAADEAFAAAVEAGCDEKDARSAAGLAYCAAMPVLPATGSPQLYIAAVAQGVLRRYITATDGRLMLYAAQLHISDRRTQKGMR